MCSASHPSSRPMTDAMRSAKHFLPKYQRCHRSPSRSSRFRASRGNARCTCAGRCRATDVGAVGERRAHRCTHGTNAPSRPADVEHLASHARHDPHAGDDVRAVRQFDADVRDGAAQRPHRERHHVQACALACSPRTIRRACARIVAGATQLLVGPASSSRSQQMNVRSSTRATSDGSEPQGSCSGAHRIEPNKRARLRPFARTAHRIELCRPSHHTMRYRR